MRSLMGSGLMFSCFFPVHGCFLFLVCFFFLWVCFFWFVFWLILGDMFVGIMGVWDGGGGGIFLLFLCVGNCVRNS